MSIWICPRCEENGRESHHMYGQTVCKRCGYKRGSDERLEENTKEWEKDVDRMRRSLGPLLYG